MLRSHCFRDCHLLVRQALEWTGLDDRTKVLSDEPSREIGVQLNRVGSNWGPKRAIFGLDSGSLGVQGQLNHRELWSGRWESNPRPKLGKLEIKL
jgi:hypothetical protein